MTNSGPHLFRKGGCCMKPLIVAFALGFCSITTTLHAETYVCQTNDAWFEKWYAERFIFVDTDKLVAKMGTGDKWGGERKLSVKKIAIGTKYIWSQELKVKNSSQKYYFTFSLRIKSDGKDELFIGNWRFYADCKTQ